MSAPLSEVNVAADPKTSKTSLPVTLPKNTFIMLTLTSFTLLLIARTTFVLGSEALDSILESHEDDEYKFEMSPDTFELLKSSKIIELYNEQEGDKAEFFPCALDDLFVQTAIEAWTSALKQKVEFGVEDESGHSPGGHRTWMKREDIDATPQEVDAQFSQMGAWRCPKANSMLIIREIRPNMYEWMHIFVHVDWRVTTEVKVQAVEFFLESHVDVDLWTQVISHESGGKRLEEISSLFAQQLLKKEESETRNDLIKRAWNSLSFHLPQLLGSSSVPRAEHHYPQHALSLCESIMEMEKITTKECTKRDAIKRDEIHRIKAIHNMAAFSKECMRWQPEIANLRMMTKLQRQLDDAKTALKAAGLEHKNRESRLTLEKMELSQEIQSADASMKQLQSEVELLHRENREMSERLERLQSRNQVLEREKSEIQRRASEAMQRTVAMQRQAELDEQVRHQKYQDLEHEVRLCAQNEEEKVRQQLAELMEGDAVLLAERAEREILQTKEREDLERELNREQQEVIQWKEKLREKESEIDYWIILALLIGGGIFAVIGLTIFVLARRSYKQMSDDMMYELNLQSDILRPYEPMPVIPSGHANRLGVHEHPAVRDVFGMKEPWDVTAGEGFHVSRITGGNVTTRGTTRESTDLTRDEDLDVPQVSGPSEYGKEGVQRLSVAAGLPPPPPNAGIDQGNDIVIEMPCDNSDQDRSLCGSE